MLGKDVYTLWLQKLISKEHRTLKHLKHLIVTPANCHFSSVGHCFQIWSWEQRCGQGCAFQFACLVRLLSLLYGYHYTIVAITTLRSMRSVKASPWWRTGLKSTVSSLLQWALPGTKLKYKFLFLSYINVRLSPAQTITSRQKKQLETSELRMVLWNPFGKFHPGQGGLSRWWLRLCGSSDLNI